LWRSHSYFHIQRKPEGVMAYRVTLGEYSGDWLRRSARSGVATKISLLILLTPATTGYALCGVFSGAPMAQQPVNASGAIAQEDAHALPLEPGKPIERELAGGESHSYHFTLAAGQFLRAVVDQRGVNLIVTLYGPDGKKIADIDSPNGSQGPEPVSVIAETTGDYRIELWPRQQKARKGRYEVKIVELRAATPQDKIRVAAERAFAEATIIGGQVTEESLRKAIEKCLEVIPLWKSVGDLKQEAYTLNSIGFFHKSLGEYQKALEYYTKALTLGQAADASGGDALALYGLGSVYDNLGEPQKALDFYNRALSIYQSIPDQSMVGATLGSIGIVYSNLSAPRKALEFFNRALEIKRGAHDPQAEATLLNNIGLAHSNLGEKQKALEFYNQALPLSRDLNDRSGEGTTLNNIGVIYSDLGEHRKALEYLDQVLQIKRAAGDRVAEAITLNNIGVVYGYLGENQKSLEYYNQALPLSRGAGSTESTTLTNIGKAYVDIGAYRKALDFYDQSISLQQANGDRRGLAVTFLGMGRAYHGLGSFTKALDFYNQSLALRRAVSDRSGAAIMLYNIAAVQRDLNNLDEARAQIEAGLQIVESLRAEVGIRSLRTSYLASVQKYYELGADILMRLHNQRPSEGFAAAALQTSERGRARILLELLAEAHADIRQGAPPSLIDRERSLQQSLDARAAAQTRLLYSSHSPEQAAAAAKEIEALTTEYEQVQAQIRDTSPRYAALTQPAPLSLKEIQSEVLDQDTLLLEYALGKEKSYLWAVTPASIESFELPKRAEVEKAAQRVYEILIARNQSAPGETPEQRRRRLDLADAEYPKASAALSQMVLGPVASQLESKRLLVVSDGMLQYVPFAALPLPEAGRRGDGATGRRAASIPVAHTPLIVEHEVVSLPSASVLTALRRETAGREAAARTIAVLADPVFQSDDPRIVTTAGGQSPVAEEAPSSAEARRSAEESGLGDFVRLRFSRQEADEIMRLAPEGKSFKALDFAASRATATRADLGQYRILHFATHGLINNLHPGLSGVVLSLVDEQGRQQNGFLRLYDIYNLKLGADLVVLSACQTALGKEYKGEGLVGLTRGFMYAGAPRVVASLWRIDDRATSELMKRFYQGALGQGLRPAAALRAAQVSMWKDRRWQAPYYWAAFTIQGEWR
jgi:CHAT domain-containing protein/Tfp pilus assembly protein PilF